MTEKHKHIWVLDASFGDVVRIEIPPNFPENGDHERLIMQAFEDEGNDRRLKDCDWMLGKASPENIYVLQINVSYQPVQTTRRKAMECCLI